MNPPPLLAQRLAAIERKTGVRIPIDRIMPIFVELRWNSGTLGDVLELELRLDLTDEAKRSASADALRALASRIDHSKGTDTGDDER